jgi:hypothetical protein
VRRAAKVDQNQSEIVAALRQIGCSVQLLHSVGAGCPDLMVGFRGDTFLLELKDGNKPPSARKKTEAQVIWHDAWRGKPVAVVCNIREALEAIGIPFRGEIS